MSESFKEDVELGKGITDGKITFAQQRGIGELDFHTGLKW